MSTSATPKQSTIFDQWLFLVDVKAQELIGVSIWSMPDYLWRDRFEEGESPEEALASAIEDWIEWDEIPADLGEDALSALDLG